MRRREVVAGLGATAAFPPAARPERVRASGKVARVGVLSQLPPSVDVVRPLWQALVDGLRERGWLEGQNLVLEGRFAGSDPSRFDALAAELVGLKVDAIVAFNAQALEAARRQTTTIPIIMVATADPVGVGFIASLARPGGNITGLSTQLNVIGGKHLELLKELHPAIERVGIIYSERNRASLRSMEAQREMATQLGLRVLPFRLDAPDEIEEAFAAIRREKPQALSIHSAPIVSAHRKQIAAFAIEQRLATITALRGLVQDGFLMSYGEDLIENFRRAARYVDRVVRGENPAELPVEQAEKFVFVINLKTARALGLTIPPSLLARADEVIE